MKLLKQKTLHLKDQSKHCMVYSLHFCNHQCKHKKLEDNEFGGDKFNNEYVTHLA